ISEIRQFMGDFRNLFFFSRKNNIWVALTKRERVVLTLRFGLSGDAPMPQREVANVLDISRSYVSRIEKKAVEKMRAALEVKDRAET
ncbi:MAG: hypothetical protein IIW14_04755, partial [Kiritimatiellae bacterium]|nr:hypothetical protein [Kiritimatiellia bacterium]